MHLNNSLLIIWEIIVILLSKSPGDKFGLKKWQPAWRINIWLLQQLRYVTLYNDFAISIPSKITEPLRSMQPKLHACCALLMRQQGQIWYCVIRADLNWTCRILRVSELLQNFPLSYAVEVNGSLVGDGVAFSFVKLLQDKYGFRYSVVLPDEDVMGTANTGIFGLLNSGVSLIIYMYLHVEKHIVLFYIIIVQ